MRSRGVPYCTKNIGLAFRTPVWVQYIKESFFPSTVPGPCWNAVCVGGQYLKQTFPSECFQRGMDVLLEWQQWLLQGLPASAWELIYTHKRRFRKVGLFEHVGFHMSNTEAASVCHIHDAGEFPCIKLLSLQTPAFSSNVTGESSSHSTYTWTGLSGPLHCYFTSSPARGRDE